MYDVTKKLFSTKKFSLDVLHLNS